MDQIVEGGALLEQTPMAALLLHWFASVFLVAVTAMLPPTKAFSILVSLYIYVIRLLVGFFVSGGLLLLRFDRSRNWREERNIHFGWLDPLPAILFCCTYGFLLVAAFVKPGSGSPFSDLGYKYWIVPTIGLSSLTWGLMWYGGLHLVMWKTMKELVVTRRAFPVPDRAIEGQYVQKGEIVSHEWHERLTGSGGVGNGYEMNQRRPQCVEEGDGTQPSMLKFTSA